MLYFSKKTIASVSLAVIVLFSCKPTCAMARLRAGLVGLFKRTSRPEQQASVTQKKTNFTLFRKNPDGSKSFWERTTVIYTATQETKGFVFSGKQPKMTPVYEQHNDGDDTLVYRQGGAFENPKIGGRDNHIVDADFTVDGVEFRAEKAKDPKSSLLARVKAFFGR